MTVMRWLQDKLLGRHPRDVVGEAIEATDDATNSARSVRQQLQPYTLEDDPFAAIVRNRVLSDAFEIPQESKIFQGPANGC